ACGRIGSHVVRQLHRRGIEVVGIDASVRDDHLRDVSQQVPLRPVDIQDLAALSRLVLEQRFSHIVHLA
ncbi:MAG: NAD-dependent epimerase/dehydratase family protein, partial [Gemmatimonadetes bacterium]|nr:NAD-dependent epimerase/dehydratase family protein [Gemmatimonadota bacterium]NIT67469.1 NAD-dependent epimerase/dehydratase family protein [Gemmatimonadota bacterium]NIY36046.1 NAD-dependent epimerase/dehydratase family protein [Gemmatimonadota bacterium]